MARAAWQSRRRREEAVWRRCQASSLASAAGSLVAMSPSSPPTRRTSLQRKTGAGLAPPQWWNRCRSQTEKKPWLGKAPTVTDRGDCSWRLFNDLIDFLAEKNLGFEGGVEKTLGRQLVNTLSDMPASMYRGGCCHGQHLRGPGIMYGGYRMFFEWPLIVCFFARTHSF